MRGYGGFPFADEWIFDDQKGTKINVVLRMKNVATTWSKIELHFEQFFKIDAADKLVWERNAVPKRVFYS